jgi:hypothetical protein
MMTTEAVGDLASAELIVRASLEGTDRRVARVTLEGCADSRVMSEMMTLLGDVHDAALHARASEVVVDFRGLEFMNSSCFKAFVTWLSRVRDLEPGAQYRIRFLSDKSKHWQRRSLDALRSFAIDLVQVEA